ncbi:MAG: hypothetical protein WC628_08375 [Candidatus Omnitrophota bacterium]
MKILSVRKGFPVDHSSTSYEFLAIDKTLGQSERKAVAKLSSRARPTKRKVSFIYHGDFNDLPGGWKPLMKKYYDVMYSESYDWWTLVFAFNTNQKTIGEIKKHDFSGSDDLGVNVVSYEDRVIISIYCRLSAEILCSDYGVCDDSYEQEEDGEGDEFEAMIVNDNLLQLLEQNRKYLKKGDCRLLYGVWKEYGPDAEDNVPPKATGMNKLPRPTKHLLSLLEQI